MLQMAVLWIVVLIALYTDLKERKIYNSVLVPGMILGLVINGWDAGWAGVLLSGKGFLLGLAIFLLPFVTGGLGAGDVKLLGTVGALMGSEFVFQTALGSALAGGVIAILLLLRQGKLIATCKRIGQVLIGLFLSRNAASLKSLEQASEQDSFPYGIAIAIGVLIATFAG